MSMALTKRFWAIQVLLISLCSTAFAAWNPEMRKQSILADDVCVLVGYNQEIPCIELKNVGDQNITGTFRIYYVDDDGVEQNVLNHNNQNPNENGNVVAGTAIKKLFPTGIEVSNREYTAEWKMDHTYTPLTETLRINIVDVDIDIDSDNNSADGIYGAAERTDEEEELEDQEDHEGKLIPLNIHDEDIDGKHDFAENYDTGFEEDGHVLEGDEGITQDEEGNDVEESAPFVPVELEIPECLDLNLVRIKIDYDGNTTSPGSAQDNPSEGHAEEPFLYTKETESMRIWLKDSDEDRYKAIASETITNADYVAPKEDYKPEDLGFSDSFRTVTLYVEGLKKSEIGAEKIQFSIKMIEDPNAGTYDWTYSTEYSPGDNVQVTLVHLDIDVDSDNNGEIEEIDDGKEHADLDVDEEREHDDIVKGDGHLDRELSKILFYNDRDGDDDGIPDYADGFSIFGITGDDAIDANEIELTEVKLQLPSMFGEDGTVKFTYHQSRPESSEISRTNGRFKATHGLRLWKTDQRTTDNDGFIESEVEIPLNEIATEDEVTIYLEAVPGDPNDEMKDPVIEMEVSFQGNVIDTDSIRVTPVARDFEVATGATPSSSYGVPMRGMNVSAEVSHHNQKLAVYHNLFSLTGIKLPVSVSQTYQGGDEYNSYKARYPKASLLGPRWSVSFDAHFYPVEDGYIYHAENGREDFFKGEHESGPLESPYGYSWKVTQPDDETIKVEYTDGSFCEYKTVDTPGASSSDKPIKRNIYRKRKYEDRYGNKITFEYNTDTDVIEKIIDDADREFIIEIDESQDYGNRLQSITDFANRTYEYDYNGEGVLTEIKMVTTDGTVKVNYAYEDGHLNSIKVNDSEYMSISGGQYTSSLTYGYDNDEITESFELVEMSPIGWAIKHTNENGVVVECQFNNVGDELFLPSKQIVDKDGLNLTTSMTYTSGLRVEEITHPLNNKTAYEYNGSEGEYEADRRGKHLVTRTTRKKGSRANPTGGVPGNNTEDLYSSAVYDSDKYFQMTSSRSEDGVSTTYAYENKELDTITTPAQTGNHVTDVTIDGRGLTTYRKTIGNLETIIGFSFNNSSTDTFLTVTETTKDLNDSSIPPRTTTQVFDSRRRMLSHTNIRGCISENTYFEFDEIKDSTAAEIIAGASASRAKTIYTYHPYRGFVETITTENKIPYGNPTSPSWRTVTKATTNTYDGLVRQKTSSSTAQGDTKVFTTHYEDGKARVEATEANNGRFTSFGYDSASRQLKTVHFDNNKNADDVVSPGKRTRLELDDHGNVVASHLQVGDMAEFQQSSSDFDCFDRAARTTDVVTGDETTNIWNNKGLLVDTETDNLNPSTNQHFQYSYHSNGELYQTYNMKNGDSSNSTHNPATNTTTSVDIINKTRITKTNAFGEVIEEQYDGHFFVTDRNEFGDVRASATGDTLSEANLNLQDAPQYEYDKHGNRKETTLPGLANAKFKQALSSRGNVGVSEDGIGTKRENNFDEDGSQVTDDEAVATSDSRSTNNSKTFTTRQSSVTRNGQTTTTSEDINGFVESMTFNYGGTQVTESFSEDGLGRPATWTRKDNQLIMNNYYGLDANPYCRLQLKEECAKVGGVDKVITTYENYNILGKPTILKRKYNINDDGDYVQLTHGYYLDANDHRYGMLRSETTQIFGAHASAPHVVEYDYHSDGKVKSVLYPSGDNVQYTYVLGSILKTIKNGEGTGAETLVDYTLNEEYQVQIKKTFPGGLEIDIDYQSMDHGLISGMKIGTNYFSTFAYENRGLKSQTGQWTTALALYDRAYGYDKLNRYRSSTPGANDKFGAEAQNLDQFESRLGEAYVDGETIQYALSGSRNQYASASGPALLGNKRGSRMFENAGQWQFTNINFQCAVSAAPKGFSDDRGHLYGARNGEVYGWSVDNFNGIYHPHENAPTPAHQSYNTLVNGLSWEIEVDNGTYFVELVAGTPIDETSRHIVNVEGIAFLDGTAAPGKTYITAMREVSVTDGKLTLTDGGSDNGGAQIVYIRIGKQLPSNGVLPEPTEETIIHHPVGAREEDGTFQYSWNLVDVTPNELTNKLYDPASPTKPVPASSKNIYDATGRRVAVVYFGQDGSSVFKSTRFVYNGVNIIEEKSLDGNTTFKKHFYEGVNRPIVTDDLVTGQRCVAITDDRGTLMGVANDSGQILEQIHYNASGLMKVHDGTGVAKVDSVGNNIGRSELMPFGWTGYYKDDFSGFYLTLFRWFDPLHNRWLSEDPAGHMDGLNLYAAYMGVNSEDVYGLKTIADYQEQIKKLRKEKAEYVANYKRQYPNARPKRGGGVGRKFDFKIRKVQRKINAINDLANEANFTLFVNYYTSVGEKEEFYLDPMELDDESEQFNKVDDVLWKQFYATTALDVGTLGGGFIYRKLAQKGLKEKAKDAIAKWIAKRRIAKRLFGDLGYFNQAIGGRIKEAQAKRILKVLKDKYGTRVKFGAKKNVFDGRDGENIIYLTSSGSGKMRKGVFYEEVQHAIDFHEGVYEGVTDNLKLHAITAEKLINNKLLPTTAADDAALRELIKKWSD